METIVTPGQHHHDHANIHTNKLPVLYNPTSHPSTTTHNTLGTPRWHIYNNRTNQHHLQHNTTMHTLHHSPPSHLYWINIYIHTFTLVIVLPRRLCHLSFCHQSPYMRNYYHDHHNTITATVWFHYTTPPQHFSIILLLPLKPSWNLVITKHKTWTHHNPYSTLDSTIETDITTTQHHNPSHHNQHHYTTTLLPQASLYHHIIHTDQILLSHHRNTVDNLQHIIQLPS